MNLNLPRFNCTYFRLNGEYPVSEDRDTGIQSLMTKTHCHYDDDGVPQVALFGSKFTTGGIVDRGEGALHRIGQGDNISCRLRITSERAIGELSRPPRDYRPVSDLIDSASELLGNINVRCHAIFEYARSDGYKSKVQWPIPLILPDGEGVTHIEGAEFSRRDGDDVEYRILVTNSEERDSLIHAIHFERTLELNRDSIRDLRNRSRSISTRLLTRPKDN